MAMSKKTSKKKVGADFGAALVKARQDTDHIFKQASEDENSAEEMSNRAKNGSPNFRSKAAAWAWHQRGGGGGSSSGGSPENVRNRALVVVRRSSRFKAEALRINAKDTVVKAEHKWDPNQSLFDTYELLSVARELDKALNHQQAPVVSAPSSMKKSRSSSSSSNSIHSGGVDSAKPMGRLLRLLPTPVLCLSEDDVATTTSSFKKKPNNNTKNSSMGSSSSGGAFDKISKAIQLLRYSPPADSNEDLNSNAREQQEEEHHHHHEHFHHHHHHHHHVDVLSVPERS